MIKFFRKIRQNLLSEGKTGKYLKYAIGEIILVVIGILIALQINNWNENRKNRITEADYYCRILDDFELNEKLIDETSEQISNKIKLAKELLLDLNTIPNNRSDILDKFVLALRQDVFVPSNIAFEEITSSGQLKLLTDLELKNRLIQHSTFLNNILNLLQENRNVIINGMSDFELKTEFGFQDLDYLKRELDEKHIALLPKNNWTNDPNNPIFIKFQDNLVLFIGMLIRQKHHLSNLKTEMQEPLKLLKAKKCQ